MKLSFSINGWNGYSWEDFVTAAQEARALRKGGAD